MTFAEKVIHFNQHLQLQEALPEGIRVMNPFQENPGVPDISAAFYRQYYNDQYRRKLILGINPGRLGAGATGIPFTDPKRLQAHCGISSSMHLHEPSSVFVYEVIAAYGGVEEFYSNFYISSVCPLGFVKKDKQGKETNYNYYDSATLARSLTPFIVASIKSQLAFGIDTGTAYCLGTGKNYQYLKALNAQYQFFRNIIPLEHPRYVMQYKNRAKDVYIDKYMTELTR